MSNFTHQLNARSGGGGGRNVSVIKNQTIRCEVSLYEKHLEKFYLHLLREDILFVQAESPFVDL